MLGGRSAGSDSDNEPDAASEQEAELLKLTTHYRLLENERNMHIQKINEQIKKQKTELMLLDKEKTDLETNLKIVENSSKHPSDKRTIEDLKNIKTEKELLEEEIQNEKKKHLELDAEIKDEKKATDKNMKLEKTSKKDSTSSSKGKNEANVKRIEDQLQLANNKFGKMLEANRILREELDDLRVRRQRFDTLYGRLDTERQSLQMETSNIIQQSTLAYDQRVEAHEKIKALNEKAQKDEQVHNSEMRELVRIIDHDRRLHNFMTTKGKARDEDNQLKVWREKKEAAAQERKKAMQTDTVDSYEEAFQRIQDMTNEKDIQVIATKFIEVEDENFALYNFVNNQNDVIEHLKDSIAQIEGKIEQLELEGVQSEEDRLQKLTSMESKKKMFAEKALADEQKLNKINSLLDQIKSRVVRIFDDIKCERGEVDKCLGAEGGISYKNLLTYLALVEQQTNQLLLAQSYNANLDETKDKKEITLLGEGPIAPRHTTYVTSSNNWDLTLNEDNHQLNGEGEEEQPLLRSSLTTHADLSFTSKQPSQQEQVKLNASNNTLNGKQDAQKTKESEHEHGKRQTQGAQVKRGKQNASNENVSNSDQNNKAQKERVLLVH